MGEGHEQGLSMSVPTPTGAILIASLGAVNTTPETESVSVRFRLGFFDQVALLGGVVLLHLRALADLRHQIVLAGHADRQQGVGHMAQCLLAQGGLDQSGLAVGRAHHINSLLSCHGF